MATYPTGIKSFTNPVANDHMNLLSHAQQHTDANDEITAIETAIGTALTWTDYSATSTIVGWSSFITKKIYTKKIGALVFVSFYLYGTSNSTSVTFTLPYTSANGLDIYQPAGLCTDDSSTVTPSALITLPNSSATVTAYKTQAQGAWTASGSKLVTGQFFYESA